MDHIVLINQRYPKPCKQPLHSIFTTFCSLNHGRFLPFVFNLDFHIVVSLQTLQCTSRVKGCTWVIPALALPLHWDQKLKILLVRWETQNNHVLAAVVRAQMIHPRPLMKRAGGPTSAMDWLSALPDELLHVILSFLPAPLVVQPSLLSRRWRRLWRSTPHQNRRTRLWNIFNDQGQHPGGQVGIVWGLRYQPAAVPW